MDSRKGKKSLNIFECENNVVGGRRYAVRFYIFNCAQKSALGKMIKECGGILENNPYGHNTICIASTRPTYDLREVFSSTYIHWCILRQTLLDIKLFRFPDTRPHSRHDPMDVLLGKITWNGTINTREKHQVSIQTASENLQPCCSGTQGKRKRGQVFIEDSSSEVYEPYTEGEKEMSQSDIEISSSEEFEPPNRSPKKNTGSCNKPTSSKRLRSLPYTSAERQAILKYIIDNSFYGLVGGVSLWKKMADEKVVGNRPWQSLKEHFRKQILPKINSFNISQEAKEYFLKKDVPINQTFSLSQQDGLYRKFYRREEDLKIIKFLLQRNRYKKYKGVCIWKFMEKESILKDRTWQSLKNRFIQYILPNINYYEIDQKDKEKFNFNEGHNTEKKRNQSTNKRNAGGDESSHCNQAESDDSADSTINTIEKSLEPVTDVPHPKIKNFAAPTRDKIKGDRKIMKEHRLENDCMDHISSKSNHSRNNQTKLQNLPYPEWILKSTEGVNKKQQSGTEKNNVISRNIIVDLSESSESKGSFFKGITYSSTPLNDSINNGEKTVPNGLSTIPEATEVSKQIHGEDMACESSLCVTPSRFNQETEENQVLTDDDHASNFQELHHLTGDKKLKVSCDASANSATTKICNKFPMRTHGRFQKFFLSDSFDSVSPDDTSRVSTLNKSNCSEQTCSNQNDVRLLKAHSLVNRCSTSTIEKQLCSNEKSIGEQDSSDIEVVSENLIDTDVQNTVNKLVQDECLTVKDSKIDGLLDIFKYGFECFDDSYAIEQQVNLPNVDILTARSSEENSSQEILNMPILRIANKQKIYSYKSMNKYKDDDDIFT